jgi:hypothetical protein
MTSHGLPEVEGLSGAACQTADVQDQGAVGLHDILLGPGGVVAFRQLRERIPFRDGSVLGKTALGAVTADGNASFNGSIQTGPVNAGL